MAETKQNVPSRMRVASLFSGIGGFELGFAASGMTPVLFCETDPHALAVLRAAWPDAAFSDDVRTLEDIPECDVVTAGFPCQDLSQAGKKAGIGGDQSGLVEHLFRLIRRMTFEPRWIVVENVPYMLGLNRGHAMEQLIANFEGLGFRWGYRVVDSRAFGIPQRRPRVIFVASRIDFPQSVLAGEGGTTVTDEKPAIIHPASAYGFYWTEGNRGLGWVRDGVPPIKGGSGLGIPSPPAVWVAATGELGKLSITDAERLQGFPGGWTAAAMAVPGSRIGVRWRLIGNAVNVATARWLGERLASPKYSPQGVEMLEEFSTAVRWPASAMGGDGVRLRVAATQWPEAAPIVPITSFLSEPLVPLSQRAAFGFLNRALSTPKLVYAPKFLDSLRSYCGLAKSYNFIGKQKQAG